MHKITANKAGTACYENCHFKILIRTLSPHPYELGKHQQFDCRLQTLFPSIQTLTTIISCYQFEIYQD